MPIFITITSHDGTKLRVNASLISLYYKAEEEGNRTTAIEINGARFFVEEDVATIDKKIDGARINSLFSVRRS